MRERVGEFYHIYKTTTQVYLHSQKQSIGNYTTITSPSSSTRRLILLRPPGPHWRLAARWSGL